MRRIAICSLSVFALLAAGRAMALEVVLPGAAGEVHVFIFDAAGGDLPSHVGPAGDACGDGTTRNKLIGVKWSSFPVTIHYDGTSLEGIAAGGAAAARAAFQVWDDEEHPGGSFFSEVASASSAKVKVLAGPVDGALGTLAVTSYTYNRFTRLFVSATVTFDTAEIWGLLPESCVATGSSFDVQAVGAHEAGHVVGLAHVSDSLQTMYTYGSAGKTLGRTLGRGDQAGIDKLY
ncbi:MAG: matrixin family metalloprotease [Planctomycetes bacterium]|nr:matrixin family metalloprotease [Planctomycetota bacterium]